MRAWFGWRFAFYIFLSLLYSSRESTQPTQDGREGEDEARAIGLIEAHPVPPTVEKIILPKVKTAFKSSN